MSLHEAKKCKLYKSEFYDLEKNYDKKSKCGCNKLKCSYVKPACDCGKLKCSCAKPACDCGKSKCNCIKPIIKPIYKCEKNCNDTRNLSQCDEPYRICNHGKIKLNVQPPVCLFENPVYERLYAQLYNGILDNSLEVALRNMINANNAAAYNSLLIQIVNIFGTPLGTPSPRITVSQSNGVVIYDTAKGINPLEKNTNTYENWKNGTIHENLNTRVAVLATQLFACGVGYETQFATTTGTNQANVAIRAGKFLNNPGTFRLSVNV